MGKSILILGGARSGKSRFAEQRGEGGEGRHIYIATGQAFDDEMADRIARHRAERARHWETVECPLDLPGALAAHDAPDTVILVDCLTLWLSNLLIEGRDMATARTALTRAIGSTSGVVLLVSNEVGQGIVPDNALARQFRDEAGWLHQSLAVVVDEVWFVTAGLPQRLK